MLESTSTKKFMVQVCPSLGHLILLMEKAKERKKTEAATFESDLQRLSVPSGGVRDSDVSAAACKKHPGGWSAMPFKK